MTLKEILSKPGKERKLQDVNRVKQHLANYQYFIDLRSRCSEQQYHAIEERLSKALKYSFIRKGHFVYKIGQSCQKFIIVLQGEAVQLLPKNQEEIENEQYIMYINNQSPTLKQFKHSVSMIMSKEVMQNKHRINRLRKKSQLIASLSNSPAKNTKSTDLAINQIKLKEVLDESSESSEPRSNKRPTTSSNDNSDQDGMGDVEEEDGDDENENEDQEEEEEDEDEDAGGKSESDSFRKQFKGGGDQYSPPESPIESKRVKKTKPSSRVLKEEDLAVPDEKAANRSSVKLQAKLKRASSSELQHKKAQVSRLRERRGTTHNLQINTHFKKMIEEDKKQKDPILRKNQEEFKKCFRDLRSDQLHDVGYFYQGQNILKFQYGKTLRKGDVIGDHEIMKKKSNRETTVVAIEDLHLGYLTAKEFSDILEPRQNIKFNKRMENISQILGEKSQQLKYSLAYLLQFITKHKYRMGQMIYQENEEVNGCYIIVKGEIQIFKSILLDAPQDYVDPSEVAKSQIKIDKVLISKLGQGQYLGEDEIIKKDRQRLFSAECNSEVTTYFVEKFYFWQTLCQNNELLEFFIDHVDTKLQWLNLKLQEQIATLQGKYKREISKQKLQEQKIYCSSQFRHHNKLSSFIMDNQGASTGAFQVSNNYNDKYNLNNELYQQMLSHSVSRKVIKKIDYSRGELKPINMLQQKLIKTDNQGHFKVFSKAKSVDSSTAEALRKPSSTTNSHRGGEQFNLLESDMYIEPLFRSRTMPKTRIKARSPKKIQAHTILSTRNLQRGASPAEEEQEARAARTQREISNNQKSPSSKNENILSMKVLKNANATVSLQIIELVKQRIKQMSHFKQTKGWQLKNSKEYKLKDKDLPTKIGNMYLQQQQQTPSCNTSVLKILEKINLNYLSNSQDKETISSHGASKAYQEQLDIMKQYNQIMADIQDPHNFSNIVNASLLSKRSSDHNLMVQKISDINIQKRLNSMGQLIASSAASNYHSCQSSDSGRLLGHASHSSVLQLSGNLSGFGKPPTTCDNSSQKEVLLSAVHVKGKSRTDQKCELQPKQPRPEGEKKLAEQDQSLKEDRQTGSQTGYDPELAQRAEIVKGFGQIPLKKSEGDQINVCQDHALQQQHGSSKHRSPAPSSQPAKYYETQSYFSQNYFHHRASSNLIPHSNTPREQLTLYNSQCQQSQPIEAGLIQTARTARRPDVKKITYINHMGKPITQYFQVPERQSHSPNYKWD